MSLLNLSVLFNFINVPIFINLNILYIYVTIKKLIN